MFELSQTRRASPPRQAALVIGRVWRIQSAPPANAHSTSCGVPNTVSMRAAVTVIAATSAGVSASPLRRVSATSRTWQPSPAGATSHASCFSPTSTCFTAPLGRSTTIVSASTAPETRPSPRPNTALTTISSRRPEVGLWVKTTPLVSARTIRWTMTAISTRASRRPHASR